MSEQRIYPRKVWVLMPSYKPVEIVVYKKYESWSDTDYGDITVKGKLYDVEKMHPTKQDAIAAGLKIIELAQTDLDKRAIALTKKRDALIKAGAP